jgi:ATP-binding cassette subfamily B protein
MRVQPKLPRVATSFLRVRRLSFRRGKNDDASSVRRLLKLYLRGRGLALAVIAVLAILAGFAEAGLLVLVARIATSLAAGHGASSLVLGPIQKSTVSIGVLLAAAGVLVALRGALQAIGLLLSTRLSVGVGRSTQQRLLRLFLNAGWPIQASQRHGRLQELTTEYASYSSGAVTTLVTGATAAFSLAALLVTALFVNVVAAVATAFAALLIGGVVRPLRAAARRRSRRNAEARLVMATGVTELVATLQDVRIFGVEDRVRARLDGLVERAAQSQQSTDRMSGLITVVYQGSAMMLVVGALAVAYAASFSELSSLGAMALIMVRALSYGQMLQASIQSIHIFAPYLEVLRDEQAGYRAAAVERGGAPVDSVKEFGFEHVWFEYVPGHPALRDITFDVKPGEIIGIVGPSGSGKSTLIQLLLRLRQPTAGRIVADGRDVREFDLDEWYRHVSFVPQDLHLFADTVAENIRFFRENVDGAAIEHAARLANLHDDIVAWPLGYDTPVGERGSAISGGQRQRLCIARALVAEPDILVLDEPTSSLDVKSETLVRETVAGLAPRTTVLVIAHRLSTLSICDRIMVIRDGRLQGFDEPAKLEATNAFYREALLLSAVR